MATPAHLALQRQLQAPEPEGAGAASKVVVTALWVLGLFTASVAITLAVREPLPAGVLKNVYLLALSVAFFAGVAGVIMAAVCIEWPTTPTAGSRRATGRKLVYSAAAAVAVGGLMVVVVSLLW